MLKNVNFYFKFLLLCTDFCEILLILYENTIYIVRIII